MMPDADFEAYLALLSRFLRLGPQQREEIRRELRAHVEEALDEYVTRGMSRHDALLRVLDDFGDAADLAARFRAIGRTRRWIMRGTATAAGIGLVALTASFFMTNSNTPVSAGFQPPGQTQSADGDAARPASPADQAVHAALAKSMPDVSYEDTPFEQVVEHIAEQLQLNVVVQWATLEESGVQRDRTLQLKLRNVTTEQVLRILLAEAGHGAHELSYQVKDGILFISTLESFKRELVTRVYDVRDLLTAGLDWRKTKERILAHRAADGTSASPPDAATDVAPSAPAAARNVYSAPAPDEPDLDQPEGALVDLLCATVEPEGWMTNGGRATTTVYNGILVVRQHELGHGEVEKLLNMLRDAGAARPMSEGVAAR